MDQNKLKDKIKKIALSMMKLCMVLSDDIVGKAIKSQLLDKADKLIAIFAKPVISTKMSDKLN